MPGAWIGRIHRDDAPPGRVVSRQEIEEAPVVAEDVVGRIEGLEQRPHRRRHQRIRRIAEIREVDSRARVGALGRGDHQVPAVVRHRRAESPFGMVRALIHQRVRTLGRAEPVVVELHVEVGADRTLARFRLGVPTVEESLAIPGPGPVRKLDPAQMIGQVTSGRDVTDPELHPVRSAGRSAVEQE
jgi:hypothetical protein